MRTTAVVAVLMLLSPLLLADTHHVEFDDKTDFSVFKTFVIGEQQVTSRQAELTNDLTIKAVEDAIRSGLSAKGLKETQDRPDLIVSFSLVEAPQRGVVGRGIQNAHVVMTSVGTFQIDMKRRDTNGLIWHGVYTDEEANAAKLAERLPGDAKKLISEYPPKKK